MKEASQKLNIRENEPLASLTTLGVGGNARYFVEAQSESDIIAAVNFSDEYELPLFILGGGSNVLISDKGFDGLVLKINLKGIDVNENVVVAQAGEDWDEFVKFCVEQNLQGVECLSGIPGLVGGTPVQNVGAYGQEVSETITKVRVFNRRTKQILELTNTDCKFSYRTSIFNTTEKNRFIVLAVTFRLNENTAPKIVYMDLKNYFGERHPTLNETRRAVLQIRRAKSMVIDPNDPNSKSAGSFFKNPVVSVQKFKQIIEAAKKLKIASIPNYLVNDENVKIPAAWLIEQSGFHKGYAKKTVGLSTNHTLAIINFGEATAGDVIELKNEIQMRVKKIFGVELVPEPVLIG